MNKEKIKALKWLIKNTASEKGVRINVSGMTIVEYDQYEYYFGIPHITTVTFSYAGDRYFAEIETQGPDGEFSIHSAKEVMIRLERLTCACRII